MAYPHWSANSLSCTQKLTRKKGTDIISLNLRDDKLLFSLVGTLQDFLLCSLKTFWLAVHDVHYNSEALSLFFVIKPRVFLWFETHTSCPRAVALPSFRGSSLRRLPLSMLDAPLTLCADLTNVEVLLSSPLQQLHFIKSPFIKPQG